MRHRGKSDRCAVYNRPLVLVGVKSRGSQWRPNARSSHDSQRHLCRKNNLRRFALGDRPCQRNQGSAAETTATITAALATAESSSRIAEAEVVKALGYELCKCQFPPTPNLTQPRVPSGTGPTAPGHRSYTDEHGRPRSLFSRAQPSCRVVLALFFSV